MDPRQGIAGFLSKFIITLFSLQHSTYIFFLKKLIGKKQFGSLALMAV